MRSCFPALTAIVLWSSFATLSMPLRHLPPLLVTGLALIVGSLVTIGHVKAWKVKLRTFVFGSGCLFLYHFFLLKSFTYGSVAIANLINYTWPFILVVLSNLCGARRSGCLAELSCCAVGFLGCAVLVLHPIANGNHELRDLAGYGFAAAAALVWATYTLLTPRFEPQSSWAVGGFCAASGATALVVHTVAGPAVAVNLRELVWIAAIGAGPLGMAFVAWNRASRMVDAGTLGAISYLCPPLSLLMLRFADPASGIDWLIVTISIAMSAWGIFMSQRWRLTSLSTS
ncbi:EamA/RhaT family transporter [Paraburkholderia bengalensis]|uniref:EamA/RhaT family transporter n=1 Tax=Paraburkholderia bengalensis TaxID=2747562 RepID=A0ABU8IKT1_9BURK